MCGKKPCRACAAKVGRRKTSSMARRKFSVSRKGILDTAVQGLTIYAGYGAGKALVNNVQALQDNPLFGIGAQMAGAIILGRGRNQMQRNFATGMAVSAVQEAVTTLLPNLSQQLGINGPWGSYINPGVSGRVGAPAKRPVIRVQ